MKILVLNGPNLNFLGIREPNIYGKTTYAQMIEEIQSYANEIGVDASFYQSNHEGDLIDKIQEAYFDSTQGILINPGAYTHTSIAILDALKSTSIPTVEVHLSKVEEREEFRKFSYVSLCAKKTITGLGIDGYKRGLDFLKEYLKNQ